MAECKDAGPKYAERRASYYRFKSCRAHLISKPITKMTTPNLEVMKRADLPAIWSDFRDKIAALKSTAETLTVTSEDDRAEMKLARQTRLNLREIRIAVESRRKELGEDALRRKQSIDADAKAIKDAIEPMEARLLECEEYAERAMAVRAAVQLSARIVAVTAAKGDPVVYNLADCTDEAFDAILAALDAAEKARFAAADPDKAKLSALAADIRAIKIPDVSDAALRILIATQREKFAAWIETK